MKDEERSITIPTGIWTCIPDTSLDLQQNTGHNCSVSVDEEKGIITVHDKALWKFRTHSHGR